MRPLPIRRPADAPMTPPRPDAPPEETLARARAGDAEAFGRLYQAHAGQVYALCLRLTADHAEAAEAMQDAFVRVWQKLPAFRGDSALGTWIHRIAVNTVLERRRADGRRTARVESTASVEELHPAARPELVDERLDLDAALARLSSSARTVFVLHAMEGYAFREIAELTGATEVALRSQLHRARRQLLELLDR